MSFPNPYSILGFMPGDNPSRETVGARYINLTKIHFQDNEESLAIYRQLTDAYNKIDSDHFPGIFHYTQEERSIDQGSGWSQNPKGNWIFRFPNGDYGTVYKGSNLWKWVFCRIYADQWFATDEEAKADFEANWVNDG